MAPYKNRQYLNA